MAVKELGQRSSTTLRATIAVAVVVLLALLWIAVRARSPLERREEPPEGRPWKELPRGRAERLSLAPRDEGVREARSPLDSGMDPVDEDGTASIRGRVLLPDGSPCPEGLALAWAGADLPPSEEFVGLRPGEHRARVVSAPIGEDGSFLLMGLADDAAYTLSAVTRGAVCAERLERVSPGGPDVTVQVAFTYGLALRLQERGGGPIRTNPLLFGGRRSANGTYVDLNSPRELHALGIEGLRAAHDRHDRWQLLVASDDETDARSSSTWTSRGIDPLGARSSCRGSATA